MREVIIGLRSANARTLRELAQALADNRRLATALRTIIEHGDRESQTIAEVALGITVQRKEEP